MKEKQEERMLKALESIAFWLERMNTSKDLIEFMDKHDSKYRLDSKKKELQKILNTW